MTLILNNMKKAFFILSILLAAVSCSKEKGVIVKAAFTTNKDVVHVGEDIVISNNSTVENGIFAMCQWSYGPIGDLKVEYKDELESVVFDEPGTYIISLTVYAEQGSGRDSYTRTVIVNEENDIPWAEFVCPTRVKVGEEVTFEDKSVDEIGGIVSWEWEIDGVESIYQSPSMIFSEPKAGAIAKLTVKDAFGETGSMTKLFDIVE